MNLYVWTDSEGNFHVGHRPLTDGNYLVIALVTPTSTGLDALDGMTFINRANQNEVDIEL